MPNPYGITEVDVPGALSALEAARSNRIRQMLLQRQLQQEERQLETQRGVRSAVERYTGGTGASAAASPATVTATPAPATPEPGASMGPGIDPAAAMASPAPAAVPAAAPAGHGDLGRLTTDLMAIDPEHAPQIIQAFRQMDDAQFTAAQRRNTVLARAAYTLLAMPEAERSAEFQRIAPDLIANGGVTRQQLAGFQLTEANLRHVINQARDVEKLAEEARPEYRNVSAGDVIIDENRIDPATGRPRVVMESPYIRGPDGTIYERTPGATGTAPTGGGNGQPRGIRNNNPGNLEDGPFARSQPGYVGSDGRFARFETAEQGNRAQEVLLRSRYLQRPQTARQIVDRYAPPGENSPESRANYARHIEQRLGISPGQPIDASRARELAQAMREFENGTRGPAPSAQPTRVASRAEYDRLPSGAEYIAPDGSHRRKP